MSIRKRIADLSAALTVDTREYEAGMRRAAKATGDTGAQISATMGKLEKVGLKLGLGFVGGGGALSMLTGEIRNVIENIENIPGIPASTVASIQQTRFAFAQSRQAVDQAIAGVVSFTSWVARAAGFAGGALVYGLDAAEQAYWDFGRSAANAASAQERQAAAAKAAAEETAAGARIIAAATAAQDKTTSAQEQAIQRLQRARAAFEQKDESAGQRMVRLKAEAAAAGAIADAATKEGRATADSVNARSESLEKLVEADKAEKELVKAAQEHLKAWNDFYDLLAGSSSEESPVEMLTVETHKASEAAIDMGFAFQSAFEDAILTGAKLSDVLKGLAQDVIRIALRTAITAPLGKAVGGLFSGLFGGGGAGSSIGAGIAGAFGGGKAEGGPVSGGTPYLVGEQGPELFTPRTAGHITPNGGGQAGSTYYIDARGADRTGLARLEAMIRSVNGSIENRALGAVADFRRRGASFA